MSRGRRYWLDRLAGGTIIAAQQCHIIYEQAAAIPVVSVGGKADGHALAGILADINLAFDPLTRAFGATEIVAL